MRNYPPLYAQGDFTLHVLIKRVSKDAGISSNGLIVYRDSIPFARIDLSVEDGRWNDFSTLFIENGEEMGKNLRKMIRAMQYELALYKKSLLIKKE